MPRTRDTDKTLWGITGCYCLQCQFPLMPVIGTTTPPERETENEK